MPSEEQPQKKLLRIVKVCDATGLPQSSIYAMMSAGEFPRPVQLSANRVAWVEADVQRWINHRIEAGRLPAKPGRQQRRVQKA